MNVVTANINNAIEKSISGNPIINLQIVVEYRYEHITITVTPQQKITTPSIRPTNQ